MKRNIAIFLCINIFLDLKCFFQSHLDHCEQTLVGGGVSRNGETPIGVPGDDAVHGAPGRSVRLVFVRHGQVGNDDVHTVLVNFPKELTQKQTKTGTRGNSYNNSELPQPPGAGFGYTV